MTDDLVSTDLGRWKLQFGLDHVTDETLQASLLPVLVATAFMGTTVKIP
jgi:hypothetical protein